MFDTDYEGGPDKKPSYVNSEPIQRLRGILGDTRNFAEALRDGLSPVLRSYDPKPSPDGPARVAELLSPACQEIEELGEAALVISFILQDTLERLQLPSFGPAEKYNEADVEAPELRVVNSDAMLGLPELWDHLNPLEQESVAAFARGLLPAPGLGNALYGAAGGAELDRPEAGGR